MTPEKKKPEEITEAERAGEQGGQVQAETQDFKEDLKKLLAKIQAAINEVITLRITTIVGDVTPQEDGPPTVSNGHTLYTEIKLVDGDIVSKVDRWFLQDENKIMRDLHEQREKQAKQIIKDNLAALKELADYVQELIDSLD